MDSQIKYKFVGKGLGVNGLPHEISDVLAAQYQSVYEENKAIGELKIKTLPKEERTQAKETEQNRLVNFPHIILQAALKNGNYKEIKPKKE